MQRTESAAADEFNTGDECEDDDESGTDDEYLDEEEIQPEERQRKDLLAIIVRWSQWTCWHES